MKNNVLLSLFLDLPKEKLVNFISSFRKYNSKDDVFILMDNRTKKECDSLLSEFNINTIEYIHFYLDIFWLFHQRHIYYQDFLLKNEFNKVIISDSTDIVFQDNPFKKIKNDLYLFGEGLKIGEEK
jgi:hypothetical protein